MSVFSGDLRAYVMDTSEVLGARLVQKFKGVNHAVEHRYLRELMLVVSATEEDEKDAIEMYTWRLRYDVDGNPEAELRQYVLGQYVRRPFHLQSHLKSGSEPMVPSWLHSASEECST